MELDGKRQYWNEPIYKWAPTPSPIHGTFWTHGFTLQVDWWCCIFSSGKTVQAFQIFVPLNILQHCNTRTREWAGAAVGSFMSLCLIAVSSFRGLVPELQFERERRNTPPLPCSVVCVRIRWSTLVVIWSPIIMALWH